METEDEMIQRLIKEGLAKTETDEEKIQRLIKEGLTKTETEDERVQRLVREEIARGVANKEWETKKRQALASVAWYNTDLPVLVMTIMGAYAFEWMQIIAFGWAIAIAFFIIMVALHSYLRNQTLKQWESPESYERITHKKFE